MTFILAYLCAYIELALLILGLVWIVKKIAGVGNPKRRPRLSPFATRISAIYRRAAPTLLGVVATMVLLFLAALALNSIGFSRRPRNAVAMRTAVHADYKHPWPVSDRLAQRLSPDGTIMALSISGGGSRAAYFTAVVLERLSHIQYPGSAKFGDTVLRHIDLISSISGGSLAAAYFTARHPDWTASSDVWRDFFQRFKDRMATNFENRVIPRLWAPWRVPGFALFHHGAIEELDHIFDDVLFDGQQLEYSSLLQKEWEGQNPILVINASIQPSLEIFSFTDGTEASRVGETPQKLEPFGYGCGDLGRFPVSAAVAASAAFPGLGTIPIECYENLDLADGGLVDNSGLAALYEHIFRRPLFQQEEGAIKRVIVLVIDASGGPERKDTGVLTEISALSDSQQTLMSRFEIPAAMQAYAHDRLGYLFDQHPVQVATHYFTYRYCGFNHPPIPTAFHLTSSDRDVLDTLPEGCVTSADQSWIAQAVQDKLPEHIRQYEGILHPNDITAYREMYDIACDEVVWNKKTGAYATLDQLLAGRLFLSNDTDCLGGGSPEKHVLLKKDLVDAQKTGFNFNIEPENDSVWIYATPVRYRETGYVSMALHITPSKEAASEHCLQQIYHAVGADHRGQPALATDPVFYPKDGGCRI
jgi:predicted acylesterase/phospholipase RssA